MHYSFKFISFHKPANLSTFLYSSLSHSHSTHFQTSAQLTMHSFTLHFLLFSSLFFISQAHIRPSHHQLSITIHAGAGTKPSPASNASAPAPAAVSNVTAPAPVASAPPPPANITAAMAKKGCKTFADLLASTPDAASTFQSSTDGGISVFCPSDSAMSKFMPKFKNLTKDAKLSLLLYHAIPVYYSLSDLKSSNGVMNTLATDGTSKNYNFTVQNDGDHITLKTASDSPAEITGTVIDKEPVAIFSINEVLQPEELFAPVEASAPAPGPVADSPKAAKGKKTKKHTPVADAPGPDSDGDTADQTASDSAGIRVPVRSWSSVLAMVMVMKLVLV